MLCPTDCGGETIVTKTQDGENLPQKYGKSNVIRRTRICEKCKVRFTTIEMNESDLPRMPGRFVGR